MRIVLGLGNPGRRYEATRHNAGFRVAEALATRLGARFRREPDELADTASASAGGDRIVIAKPQTWMNRSGSAAASLCRTYAAAAEDLIVTYDDVALPLGSVRIRPSGRSAGQKGMESILQELGSDAIPRVRLGILGERAGADLAEYVLEPFAKEEIELAEAMFDRAAGAIVTLLESGIERAMNEHNRWDTAPE